MLPPVFVARVDGVTGPNRPRPNRFQALSDCARNDLHNRMHGLGKGCCETPSFQNWWFEPAFSRRMALDGISFGVAGVTAGPATRQDRDHSRWPMSPQPGGPVLTTVNVQLETRDCRGPVRARSSKLLAAETVGASGADFVRGADHGPEPTIGSRWSNSAG